MDKLRDTLTHLTGVLNTQIEQTRQLNTKITTLKQLIVLPLAVKLYPLQRLIMIWRILGS